MKHILLIGLCGTAEQNSEIEDTANRTDSNPTLTHAHLDMAQVQMKLMSPKAMSNNLYL